MKRNKMFSICHQLRVGYVKTVKICYFPPKLSTLNNKKLDINILKLSLTNLIKK